MAMENKPVHDDYIAEDYYNKIVQVIVRHTKLFEQGAAQPLKLGDGARSSKEPQPELSNQLPASAEIRKTLRNQRALMKALTRNIDEIFAHREEVHHPSYYNIKATIIEKYMIDLSNNNAVLWTSTENDQIEDYNIQTFYELEEKAEAAMIELQQHIQDTPPNPSNRTTAPGDSDVILPKIKLPSFDGNYQQWVEFKDIFSELVHNTAISDTKKMQYLTTSLHGEPKNLIKHLPAVGINYAAAWSIISSRYDNKRLLVSTLLNKLMSESSSKRESAQALKSLHDTTKECIQGLKAQDIPVQHWDVILVHIVMHKLDEETQTAFEQSLTDNRRLININELLSFLERRFQSLETRGKGDRTTTRTCASVTASDLHEKCKICKGEAHKIYVCKKFANAELNQRWKWVKDLQLCVNCLKPGHRVNECKSGHCTRCTKTHNTLLHNPKVNSSNNKLISRDTSTGQLPSVSRSEVPHEQKTTRVSLLTNHTNKDPHYVLLGTACVQMISENGEPIECRAILDSGSQVNLITDRLWTRLGGRSRQMCLSVEGIGVHKLKMQHQASIQIQSTITNYVAQVDVHILPKIVSEQPVHHFDVENWGIPKNIRLADPEFNTPGRIDCLLGADIVFELLIGGQIRLGNNLPILQNTIFGWVIAGRIDTSITSSAVCGICTTKELEAAVSQFWDNEETSDNRTKLTADEVHCESHFVQSTSRTQDGRFVVKLPLNNHPTMLPESKGIAYKRFYSIERRLHADPTLRDQYVAFMREYESLGHMTKINAEKIKRPYYFIPHHCVIRPESTSTKLRVVFDASAHNSSGVSLNDIMHTGPTVQSELFAILLRFRMHKYVLKTDIEKMYRQIWVHQEDRNLQLILSRENENQPISVYQLNTVTYGTRAAPYLATRCLIKLADDYQSQHPHGATSLRKDFYVDDGLIGADSIPEALIIQKQLITILGGAGMKLKKWCSNHKALLSQIAAEDQEVNLNLDSKETQATKTLGLLWLPKLDVFCIKVNTQEHKRATKRTMSSDLAHIYDPLGLIGPVVVTGKIQLQKT